MDKKLKNEAETKAQIIMNYYQSKNYELAIANAKKLLKKFPNYVFLFNIIGLSLQAKKEFYESINYFNKALQINPNYFFALNNIGLSYRLMGDDKNAQIYFEKAIERNPKFATAISNLANIKKDLNLIDDAIMLHEKALELDNNLFLTHYNLALIYQSIGNTSKAKKYFFSSLKINPNLTIADKQISLSIKYDENHPHLKEMKEKISNNKLNEDQKIQLYFALGKAYEDLKNYKTSCEYLIKGNFLKRKNLNYDFKYNNKIFEKIKTFFTIFKKENNQMKFTEQKKMIFIVGMPRSGTTLVEQILSSHSKVYGGGERNEFKDLVKNNFINEDIKKKIFKFKNNNEIKLLRNKFFDKIISKTNLINETYITDKKPTNFKWIGLMKMLFPESKIIHCSRNSKDTCLSIYKHLFLGDWKWCYKINELTDYYKIYVSLMKFWKENLNKFIYEISYEKLINNNKIEVEKLLNYCELNWEDNCLKFDKNKTPVTTMSIAQVRNPIYNSSINSWKNYEQYLKPLFDEL